MVKVLRIYDSGFVWEVPAERIAANRAAYYAERDKDATFEEEFNFTMGDDYELRDWFLNNMDWKDVKDSARFVASPAALAEPRINEEDCTVEVIDPTPDSGKGGRE